MKKENKNSKLISQLVIKAQAGDKEAESKLFIDYVQPYFLKYIGYKKFNHMNTFEYQILSDLKQELYFWYIRALKNYDYNIKQTHFISFICYYFNSLFANEINNYYPVNCKSKMAKKYNVNIHGEELVDYNQPRFGSNDDNISNFETNADKKVIDNILNQLVSTAFKKKPVYIMIFKLKFGYIPMNCDITYDNIALWLYKNNYTNKLLSKQRIGQKLSIIMKTLKQEVYQNKERI